MKFRKKPVVIDAMKFRGSTTNKLQVEHWMETGEEPEGQYFTTCDIVEMYIKTSEGTMRAIAGDWIIKGIFGEFYPCKPDVFAATYEAVK